MAGGVAGSPIVDAWLEPLADQACGADLEYDDDFREIGKAAAGKPGTQFAGDSDAEPPDWRAVGNLAESMFERTRDLRVAIYWARARLHLDGAVTLPASLRLIQGLLDRYWAELHPLPDGEDFYARVNALADMCSPGGLLGDLRDALIVDNRAIGELRGRDVEIALGTTEPRAGDPAFGRSQVEQMLRDACAEAPRIGAFVALALEQVEAVQQSMRERVGYSNAPELQPLLDLLGAIRDVMPAGDAAGASSEAEAHDAHGGAASAGAAYARGSGRAGLSGAIETRADALRAIDMVCEYLERAEPTNPAQLLLRRARRLVNKNFLELVRELAPESLGEVARIMGVSADEVTSDG
ncbi:MAG: type VI secretion system protein TssA [Caldimonas sp.]